MFERNELIELAGRLSVAEIMEYAQSRGWNPVFGAKGEISVFNHPDYRFRQLIVPKRKTDDYSEAIFEVLQRLEACEGRNMRDIARDIRKRRKIGLSFKVMALPLKNGNQHSVGSSATLRGASSGLIFRGSMTIRC